MVWNYPGRGDPALLWANNSNMGTHGLNEAQAFCEVFISGN